ncbi:HypC/HybG/HupF family hydrogenase formation chaperone [Bathymodiolus septemdierum thioautotrophic gill symbiont]|uniref:Hydrogenase expression/formation protein HypC n=1 Tax=endosymbiont of Bathymodiolus septemdierum str. Myojin knoll TaxID=1303921 RepID=A0A0P0UQI4_9GAMM|nr:HypC/HybG/HupF family hydrogenase formation chaperone [Bathymodiolus septemdierum thioautotrophic gill symbiont]BAS67248.1 hydrogenase expression/formation protein HypC [endosymbiont of Bathymodiolus septemdierum str. Myojin knoll]
MCIGIPMQVVDSVSDTFATCQDNGINKTINMQLVGPQITGTWVLVFIDAAREVISAGKAKEIDAALAAVALAATGGQEDRVQQLFGDLINREPVNPFLNNSE